MILHARRRRGFECDCVVADGGPSQITKRGSVTIEATVMGKITKVRLLDFQLKEYIICYGILEAKGLGLSYRGKHRVVAIN